VRFAVLCLACTTSCVATCVGNVEGGPPWPDGGGVDAGPGEDAGFDAGAPDAGMADAGKTDSGIADGGMDASVPDAGPPDSGAPDAGDICAGVLLCDQFEKYDAGALKDGQMIGPWAVNVQDMHTNASIDGIHAFSGTSAFHVHIDQNQASGSQIKTSAAPLFAQTRQQLYGRFMMYLGPHGTSIHWTMWGASGTVPNGTTSAGAYATYLFSAFCNDSSNGNCTNTAENIFSDVYGNDMTNQDCYHGSSQLMPTDQWACVSWALDAPARTYRMALNGTAVPTMDLNDEGDGCVNMGNQSWWGPDFEQFYMGALSFHPMTGPLDLWIDDLIVDTSPVSCP
jgi:hypothetical protein